MRGQDFGPKTRLKEGIIQKVPDWGSQCRVSAKRTLRYIFCPDAARRLRFLGQFYMVIIDHIYKNQLHASTQFYMVEYWKIIVYFPFLSFPILHHVKIGIFFHWCLPFIRIFGKRQVHCRKERIVFYKRNLENLGRPNLVSASRTPYPSDKNHIFSTFWLTHKLILYCFTYFFTWFLSFVWNQVECGIVFQNRWLFVKVGRSRELTMNDPEV